MMSQMKIKLAMKRSSLYILALILGLFLTNANAQDGQTLFNDNCTACHKIGSKLVGPDLVGVGERRTDDWLKSFITNSTAFIGSGDKDAKAIFEEYGKVEMTSFQGSFTDEEMASLVDYIKTAKPVVAEVVVAKKGKKIITVEKPATPMEIILNTLLGLCSLIVVLLLITILADLNKYLNHNMSALEKQNTPIGKMMSLFVGTYTESSEEGHEYDGIRELDNTMPPWLQGIFYITIFWAIAYIVNFHVLNPEDTQLKEYQDEMAEAAEKYGDMDVVKIPIEMVEDAGRLDAAKEIFLGKCAVCHLTDGGGSVGPNLTDEFWLNGGSLNDVFTTIRNGVPAKGMISWKGQISDEEMLDLASYIKNLKGTTPAKAKAAQGDKYIDK